MGRHQERNLDFQVSQVSDCAIVSAEISPAGVINLLAHCWSAVLQLLEHGIMCRGYVKIGRIYHTKKHFIGTGYQGALAAEKGMDSFKREADERGTPFVQIDPSVTIYIERGNRIPILLSPVDVRVFSKDTFELGRGELKVGEGFAVGLYSPERPLVDMIRLRHREGFLVAIANVRRVLARRRAREQTYDAVRSSISGRLGFGGALPNMMATEITATGSRAQTAAFMFGGMPIDGLCGGG